MCDAPCEGRESENGCTLTQFATPKVSANVTAKWCAGWNRRGRTKARKGLFSWRCCLLHLFESISHLSNHTGQYKHPFHCRAFFHLHELLFGASFIGRQSCWKRRIRNGQDAGLSQNSLRGPALSVVAGAGGTQLACSLCLLWRCVSLSCLACCQTSE